MVVAAEVGDAVDGGDQADCRVNGSLLKLFLDISKRERYREQHVLAIVAELHTI